MSCFFDSFLRAIPNSRSDIVNDLEIPEDITLEPVWIDDDEVTVASDSLSDSTEVECRTLSSDSSLPLSRAMTDSEIDYGRYRRLKNRRLSDPWSELRASLDSFPPWYLSSLNSFQSEPEDPSELPLLSEEEIKPNYDISLRERMERFMEEECRVFEPDDPGLLALEDALENIRLEDIVFDDFL